MILKVVRLLYCIKQMSCYGFCEIVVCTLHEWWVTWGHTNWPPNCLHMRAVMPEKMQTTSFFLNLINNTNILNSSPWYFPRAESYAHIGFRSLLLSVPGKTNYTLQGLDAQTGPDISPARYLLGVCSSSLRSRLSKINCHSQEHVPVSLWAGTFIGHLQKLLPSGNLWKNLV